MAEAHRVPMERAAIKSWLEGLRHISLRVRHDSPNYFVDDPESLMTEAQVHAFMTGTGAEIYESMQKTVESATREVILITCFWARSPSLDTLVEALRNLSAKATRDGTKIHVFIGFSSRSVFQKLFHTRSLNGEVYPPDKIAKKLNLPPASELPGLELRAKSIFVLPFSVMHPKFIIVDRKVVWLPSCNVSWETWFEGAVLLSGPIVTQFIRFWREFWATSSDAGLDEEHYLDEIDDLVSTSASRLILDNPIATNACFLPSPHHANPQFRLPFQRYATVPQTPLNTFQLGQMQAARTTIFIQSPNVNSPPIMDALLDSLARGVDVHIVTAERLMILEQLVTAGTTSSLAVKKFIERYERLRRGENEDVEAGHRKTGHLKIEYFKPRRGQEKADPSQSHFKVTMFDEKIVVLGSQNMDRASFYTSQELGVAFLSAEVVTVVRRVLSASLEGRTRIHYDSIG